MPYLLLSLLSGLFELGIFASTFRLQNLGAALLILLAYQCGSLCVHPCRLSPSLAWVFLVTGAVLGTAGLHLESGASRGLLFLGVVLVSGVLQHSREEWKAERSKLHSTLIKRLFRVLGFSFGIALASLLPALLLFESTVICLAGALGWRAWKRKHGSCAGAHSDSASNAPHPALGSLMVAHQMHYFVYAYVLVYHLAMAFQSQFALEEQMAFILTAIVFVAGWVSYILGETILKQLFRLTQRKALIVGHLLVTTCLVGIYLIWSHGMSLNAFILFMLLWLVGGFGGGSVYAFSGLIHSDYSVMSVSRLPRAFHTLESWENYGHVAGVALALLLCQFDAALCYAAAAVLAFTVFLGISVRK